MILFVFQDATWKREPKRRQKKKEEGTKQKRKLASNASPTHLAASTESPQRPQPLHTKFGSPNTRTRSNRCILAEYTSLELWSKMASNERRASVEPIVEMPRRALERRHHGLTRHCEKSVRGNDGAAEANYPSTACLLQKMQHPTGTRDEMPIPRILRIAFFYFRCIFLEGDFNRRQKFDSFDPLDEFIRALSQSIAPFPRIKDVWIALPANQILGPPFAL